MVCPKCGSSVEDNSVFCNSCGHKFQGSNFIFKIKNKNRNNKIIFVISSLILLLLLGLVILHFLRSSKEDGYFRSTVWGMTVNQVMDCEVKEPASEYTDHTLYYVLDDIKELDNLHLVIGYYFDFEDKLNEASWSIFNNENVIKDEWTTRIMKYLTDRYGDSYEYNEDYVLSSSNYVWETKNSIVSFIIWHNDNDHSYSCYYRKK